MYKSQSGKLELLPILTFIGQALKVSCYENVVEAPG